MIIAITTKDCMYLFNFVYAYLKKKLINLQKNIILNIYY